MLGAGTEALSVLFPVSQIVSSVVIPLGRNIVSSVRVRTHLESP